MLMARERKWGERGKRECNWVRCSLCSVYGECMSESMSNSQTVRPWLRDMGQKR